MMNAVLERIPDKISDTGVLSLLRTGEVNSEYIKLIKEFTCLTDQILSEWFNINVKTFRSYKNPDTELKENMQEHVVMLLSLYKHGLEVFGSVEDFNKWLRRENFYLSGSSPIEFVNTITGIRFIDERLTAMEYGDNV